MSPAGNTNQAIGLAHGWISLVGGGPYPPGASTMFYEKCWASRGTDNSLRVGRPRHAAIAPPRSSRKEWPACRPSFRGRQAGPCRPWVIRDRGVRSAARPFYLQLRKCARLLGIDEKGQRRRSIEEQAVSPRSPAA